MADQNVDYRKQFEDEAAKRGLNPNDVQSDYDSFQRQLSYDKNAGRNPDDIFGKMLERYDQRATNTPNQDGGSNANASPAQAWNTAPAPAQDPRASAFYDQLLQRSQQSLAVGANDPAIKGQTDAFRAEQERARRNFVSDVAEQEGPLGNIRGEQRMAAERVGQNVSGFQAQLMGRELSARREEIAQALVQMQGVLSGDQQAALQRELAQIDAQLRQQGLNLQGRGLDLTNDHFMRELALRQWQMGDDSAYRWASL
jgi:hypothetical protein